MIAWPRQPLYFAVLDGVDPHKWVPWAGGKTLGDLYDDYRRKQAGKPPSNDGPNTSFELMTAPFHQVLASQNQSNIVGVIIDARREPGDTLFYEKKMDQLDELSRSIWENSKFDDLIVKKTIKGFAIWFFIEGTEIDRWKHWVIRSHDIVSRNLGKTVEPDYVPTGELFKFAADRFLSDVHYRFLTRSR